MIANTRGLTEGTIIQHIRKLVEMNPDLAIAHLKPTDERFEKIKQAFATANTQMLTPVKNLLGEEYSYDELRLARLFL